MKVHRREFSVRKGNAIVMPGTGGGVLVAVGLTQEGRIAKIAVKQVVPGTTYNGSPAPTPSAAFTVDLLDSLPPGYAFTNYGFGTGQQRPVNGQAVDISALGLPANVDLYRVLGQKSGAAGSSIVDYATGNEGYTYRNDDGSHSDAVRLLYLAIIPGVAAPGTLWEAVLVVESAVG